MKSIGIFKFKGLTKRDGGSFTNTSGDVINYKESYSLKVDEATDKGVYERIFKVAIDSPLISQLLQLKLYEDIKLEFDVNIYRNRISLNPVALVK